MAKRLLFGMEAIINPVIESIVREFRAALQELYDDESAIDLMILPEGEQIDTITEVSRLGGRDCSYERSD